MGGAPRARRYARKGTHLSREVLGVVGLCALGHVDEAGDDDDDQTDGREADPKRDRLADLLLLVLVLGVVVDLVLDAAIDVHLDVCVCACVLGDQLILSPTRPQPPALPVSVCSQAGYNLAFKGQAFDGGVVIFACTFAVAVFCLVAARTVCVAFGIFGPFRNVLLPVQEGLSVEPTRLLRACCLVRVWAS